MEASKRGRKDTIASNVKDKETELDAGLWGKLQEHIKLQNVYEKLPHQELFRLRLVCKAWNQTALQRLEPKPHFVTVPAKAVEENQYLDGVVSYDVASQKFSFKRVRFPLKHPRSGEQPFEVEGLIFCHHPKNLKQQGVFNIHNRTWHAIPQAPEKSKQKSVIGMLVDKSERPYTFKLVVGSIDKKTQIYDSKTRSWSTRSSKVMQNAKPVLNSPKLVTCMCSNGCVYISLGTEILLMYSMEGDKWIILDLPEVKQEDGGGAVHGLGEWNGRIFTTREDCAERNLTVWELLDRTKQEWVEYVVMSQKEYDMLMDCDFANQGPSISEEMRLLACFCDGYLLIYNWQYLNGVAESLAMLNIATKKWTQVDLPPGTVGMKEGREEEDEDEEGSEDEDDEDNSERKGDGSDDEHGEDEVGNGEGSDDEEDDEDNGEGSEYEAEADEAGDGEDSEDDDEE